MAQYDAHDPNLEVTARLGREDIRLYDIQEAPFSLHGVFYDDGVFARMPAARAKEVSEGVAFHARHSAGGRVRFITDSPFVAIAAKMPVIARMPHFPLTGSSAFSLYADGRFVKTFIPPYDMTDGYESLLELPHKGRQLITIVLPTYSSVSSLAVGLQKDACVLPAPPYAHIKPVVYYGSSITQGGCASQPGNTYQEILARALNTDYINLGFSGNARGEAAMARYMAELDMSVLVLDYDHNAPDAAHLRATHEPLFRTVREAHPTLPVVFVSMPKAEENPAVAERREIIHATYRHAQETGDQNVYFVDGCSFFRALGGDSCTMDGTHPNDLGFWAMARGLLPVLQPLLK